MSWTGASSTQQPSSTGSSSWLHLAWLLQGSELQGKNSCLLSSHSPGLLSGSSFLPIIQGSLIGSPGGIRNGKTLRYSFRWTKRAAQMQTCTCFSLDEHTLAGCQLWARLGARHWGTWRIFQNTPDWNIPLFPKLSVWAQLCSIHPWSFFFFF